MFEARFQTFDDPRERSAIAARVAALRAELARRGLDGFVVPHADRQQNEYVPPSEERLNCTTLGSWHKIQHADPARLFMRRNDVQEAMQSGLFRRGWPNPMSDGGIMTKTKHDWSRADAMSDEERRVAALSDPDAQPLTPEDFQRNPAAVIEALRPTP